MPNPLPLQEQSIEVVQEDRDAAGKFTDDWYSHGRQTPTRDSTWIAQAFALHRTRAIEKAAAVADKHVQRARDAISACPKWSQSQAEWSRARDLGLDISEAIRALSQPKETGQ